MPTWSPLLLGSQFIGSQKSKNEEGYEDSHKDEEQHFRNFRGAFGDATKAEQRGDDRNHKEYGGPTKHDPTLHNEQIVCYQAPVGGPVIYSCEPLLGRRMTPITRWEV